jgi:hypothetical protein
MAPCNRHEDDRDSNEKIFAVAICGALSTSSIDFFVIQFSFECLW